MGYGLRLPLVMSSLQRKKESGPQWHGLKETQGPARVCHWREAEPSGHLHHVCTFSLRATQLKEISLLRIFLKK